MTGSEESGKLNSLFGKAEDALDNFMSDQEKVDKAKSKAKDLLSKHMDPNQADQVVNKVDDALEKFTHRKD